MAIFETKQSHSFKADTEKEAESIVEGYKSRSFNEGYTVSKTKVDYKSKKDRKSGEISEEWWNVEVTLAYDI